MARFILLDAGLLGLACSPPGTRDLDEFDRWIAAMVQGGADVLVPEIGRFEVRRELIRLRATAKLRRLDRFAEQFASAPVLAEAWERAAEFWAVVRRAGRPTAHPEALDADAILAAVAVSMPRVGDEVVIATTNVRHLAGFPGVDAREWREIG